LQTIARTHMRAAMRLDRLWEAANPEAPFRKTVARLRRAAGRCGHIKHGGKRSQSRGYGRCQWRDTVPD
jgi:hypothetical protein